MNLHHRKLHRLKDYDYGQSGAYFVTVCTENRKNLLCEIVGNDEGVVPTPIGLKVIECWEHIEKLNENVFVDQFCLMPNHIHGIIVITNQELGEPIKKVYGFETEERREPEDRREPGERRETGERRPRRSLPGLMKDFKSVTTRIYKRMVGRTGDTSIWQPSYYDEIIKNDKHYLKVWDYIEHNPVMWSEDEYFSR